MAVWDRVSPVDIEGTFMTILPIHLSVSVYFCESHGIMAFFLYEGKNIGLLLDPLCGLCPIAAYILGYYVIVCS